MASVQKLINELTGWRALRPLDPTHHLSAVIEQLRGVRLPCDKVRARAILDGVLLNKQSARDVKRFGLEHDQRSTGWLVPALTIVICLEIARQLPSNTLYLVVSKTSSTAWTL